jgi:hypothetical protein
VHFDVPRRPAITVFTTRPTRCSAPRSWCWRPSTRSSTRSTTPRAGRRGRRVGRRRGRRQARTSTARTRTARRPACSPARTPSTRSTASRSRSWIADYVLMGYGTGAIMAVPVRRPARLRVRPPVRPPIVAIQQPVVRRPRIEPTLDLHLARGLRRRRPVRQQRQRVAQPRRARTVAEGVAPINAWLEAARARQRHRHLQAARLAVQPAALLGRAVPDRLRRATAAPHALPDEMLPVELPETDTSRRDVRPRRRVERPREPARPARPTGSRSRSTWATARAATGATPT